MRISTILKGVAAVALLSSFGAANASSHNPSPCSAAEVGAGTNCMYLVAGGATNSYDGVSGDRTTAMTSTLNIDVWMDFGANAVQGGGFDVLFNTANVSSMSWAWGADFPAGEQTLDGSQTVNGWEGIQFDDFAGAGYGGNTGTQDGFALVGTLTVSFSALTNNLFQIAQPYGTATFPNCFAPGAGSGGSGCVATDFYSLQANVPLPAAVWMMLAGLGSLAGFSRRKA